MTKGVPKGIDTDRYKYWTLYINTGGSLSSEDYKTKAEAEARKEEFGKREGWKLEVVPNSNYAKPDFSNEEAYTHQLKKKIERLRQ
jgi:hypothetical protein